MRRRSLVLLLAPLALVVFLAVFLGPRLLEEESPGQEEFERLAEEAVDPGRVEVWGAWEGTEREAFEAVLAGYGGLPANRHRVGDAPLPGARTKPG